MQISSTSKTFLKKTTAQSKTLESTQKVFVPSSKSYGVESFRNVDNTHMWVELQSGAGQWYIFLPHWDISGLTVYDLDIPKGLGTINLSVPYRSQRDNRYKPHSSCALTSVAMVQEYFGVGRDVNGKQLEDLLYEEFLREGLNRFLHKHLSEEMKEEGLTSIFKVDASLDDIKSHLDKGFPVIISGNFTRSGHVLVVRGYDEKGFFVNDPYGEVMGRSQSYQATTGENLHYSYNLVKWACHQTAGRGRIWAHFPQKDNFELKLTQQKNVDIKPKESIYYELTPIRRVFLDLIAWCEGTDKNLDSTQTGYDILYGYRKFTDFSRHPRKRITSGGWTSSAAGRYQVMDYTEDDLLSQLPRLTDFSPQQQDERAIHLIKRRNALSAVDRGDLENFCQVCSWEWASIPPARYGQPIKTKKNIQEAFEKLKKIYKV